MQGRGRTAQRPIVGRFIGETPEKHHAPVFELGEIPAKGAVFSAGVGRGRCRRMPEAQSQAGLRLPGLRQYRFKAQVVRADATLTSSIEQPVLPVFRYEHWKCLTERCKQHSIFRPKPPRFSTTINPLPTRKALWKTPFPRIRSNFTKRVVIFPS